MSDTLVKPYQRVKLFPTTKNYGQQIIETNVSTSGTKTLKKDRTTTSPAVDWVGTVEFWAKKVEEAPKGKGDYIDDVRQHVELKCNVIVPGLAVMSVTDYIQTDHFKQDKAVQWFERLNTTHKEWAVKMGGDLDRMKTDYDYIKEVMGKVADFREKAEKPCAFCGVKKEPLTACANEQCQAHGYPIRYNDENVYIFLPGQEVRSWGGGVTLRAKRGEFDQIERFRRVASWEFSNGSWNTTNIEEIKQLAQALTLGVYLVENVLSRYIGKKIDDDLDLQFDFA